MKKLLMTKKLLIGAILIGVAAILAGGYWLAPSDHTTTFRTAMLQRGDLLATTNATGTVEPEEVIDVGAQVLGQITEYGRDPRDPKRPIDFGCPVDVGTVLVKIDERVYQAQVDRANAQVEQAKAQLKQSDAQLLEAKATVNRADADLGQMKAKLYQAERDWTRAQKLGPTKAITDLDYDTAEATFKTATATLAVGEATLVQAKAAIGESDANIAKSKANLVDSQAALKNAEINLHYCTITSPVKGIIVDRRVNVGQTVVSSLNAPSLFLIAKDLKRLQVWASVNEADIGHIHPGQKVTFSVDALPGRVYNGVVAPDQPRLNASMTQNVVTYTVVVITNNSDGKLLPYMTANLNFEVNKRAGVLLAPNSALRWKPNPLQVVPEARAEYAQSQQRKSLPAQNAAPKEHNGAMVWVEDGGFVRPIKVKVGPTDGTNTEIVSGDVKEGTVLVVGEVRQDTAGGATNPFTPKLFSGKPKQ